LMAVPFIHYYGFEQVFGRQVQGLAHTDDMLLAISISGRSPISWRGCGPRGQPGLPPSASPASVIRPCSPCATSPCAHPPIRHLIQQIHIVAAHAICRRIEQELFGAPAS